MATITSTIKLVDQMSPTLNKISKAIDRVNAQSKAINNTNTWNGFSSGVNRATNASRQLYNSLRRIAYTLLALSSLKGLVNIADTMMNATARLDNINDGLYKTSEYVDMIYASAQRSRGSFSDMITTVSKLGTVAGSAFNGNVNEMIAFTELMNKLFVISGASAAESSNAMYQLTQALASGRLQGDEMRSILENAPLLAQKIAEKLGVSIGELKALGAEGKITADIIKEALFDAADEIEEKFSNMPKTIGQVWNQIKNRAINAFRPVIDRIQKFLNSPTFNRFADKIGTIINNIANRIMWLFDQFERPEVQKVFKALSKPLKVLGTIINEIADAVKRAYEWILDNYTWVEIIMDAVAKGLQLIWGILKKVGQLVGKVGKWFSENWEKVAPIIAGVTAALAAYYTWMLLCKVAAGALSIAVGILNAVSFLFNTTLGNIILTIGLIVTIVYFVIQKINEVKGTAYSFIGVVWGVVGAIVALFSNFLTILTGIGQGILYTLGWLWDNFKVIMVRTLDLIVTFGKAVWNVIKALGGVIGAAVKYFFAWLGNVASNIGQTFVWLGAYIGAIFTHLFSNIGKWCQNVPIHFEIFAKVASQKFWNLVLNAIHAFNRMSQAFGEICGKMLIPVEKLVNGVLSFFGKIANAWNSIADTFSQGIDLGFLGTLKFDMAKMDVPKADASAEAWGKNIAEGLTISTGGVENKLVDTFGDIVRAKNKLIDIDWSFSDLPKYSDYVEWTGLLKFATTKDGIDDALKLAGAVGNLTSAWGDTWADREKEPWVPYDYDWVATFQPMIDGYLKYYADGANFQDKAETWLAGVGDLINTIFNGSDKKDDLYTTQDAIDEKLAIKNWSDANTGSGESLPDSLKDLLGGYGSNGGLGDALKDLVNNTGDTSGSVGNIEDTLDLAEEELELLRKLAEQEIINRFTTAEIRVDMTNNNNINSGLDLDGIVTHLSDKLYEELGVVASGVHY